VNSLLFNEKIYNFLEEAFTCLGRFPVLLLILIAFWSILVFSEDLEKNQEIQDGGCKMAAV